MAEVMICNVDDWVIDALADRAAQRGRSAEAELRGVLQAALLEGCGTQTGSALQASRVREWLQSKFSASADRRAARSVAARHHA